MKCGAGYHARWNYQLQRFIELQYVLLKQLRAQSIDTGQQTHRAAHRDDDDADMAFSPLREYSSVSSSLSVYLISKSLLTIAAASTSGKNYM